MLTLGNKQDITKQDLYSVIPEDDSKTLGRNLLIRFYRIQERKNTTFKLFFLTLREWVKERAISKCSPSLSKALIRCFGLRFLLVNFIGFCTECILK